MSGYNSKNYHRQGGNKWVIGGALALTKNAGVTYDGTPVAFDNPAVITAGSVGATELASGAVTGGKIAVDAVTATKIKDDAVTESKIKDGAVVAGKLAADAVTETTIEDGAVTLAKLASDVTDALDDKLTAEQAAAVEDIADAGSISDADTKAVAQKLNELLGALRTAGMLDAGGGD